MTIENQGSSEQQVNLSFVSQFKIDEIYKKNAFRLLQIPTTSTDRDITRRKQILEISRKTQAPIPDGPCKIFPQDPDENHLDINSLVDSLRDPVRRFYQEFFWFWPISTEKNYSDPALQALSNGSIDQARKIWAGNQADPKDYAICLHNLAVLNHFIVLNSDYMKEQNETADWQGVYKNWGDLSVLAGFWSILQDRIREVNDPRLVHEQVHELRQSALSIVTYTNAQEAIRLAERDDLDGAEELIYQIKKYPLDCPADDILRLAVSNNRERILTIATLVKQKAKNDPAHCDAEIETLLKESNRQLQIIKVVLAKETNEFKTLRNEIVEIALNATEAYMDTTDDWQRSIDLVKKIELFPITKKFAEKAKSQIEAYTEFGGNQNYWHCKDYFNNGIPRFLFDKLEKAREAYNQQNYEEATNLLEGLVISYTLDPILVQKAIHPPLAFTLSRQAHDLVGRGISTLDTPRTIIERIFENIRNKNQQCLVSLVAVENNLIQEYSKRNMLYCCSCLSTIYGTFYTGEKNELKYIICERCYQSDRAEFESIKNRAFNYFIQAKELLTRANLVQPDNLVVSTGLSTVYDILEKLYNIAKPKPKGSIQASSPPPKIPANGSVSGVNKPKRKMSGGIIALIVIVIIAAIFGCILAWDRNQYSTTTYPTRTSTPRPTAIATRTPTKRPTSVPVILNTPICPSWNTITASDKGKVVCAQGKIKNAVWGNDNNTYYLKFSNEPNTLRLFIEGGWGWKPSDIIGSCLMIEGEVVVYEGVPMIRIEVTNEGSVNNLYECN